MNPQTLVAIGIDYREQEWCSRLALTEAAAQRLLAELAAEATLAEAAVLATCNRVELYAVLAAGEAGQAALLGHLLHAAGVAPDVRPPLTARAGAEVVRHLARVACGLESLVIGETEVLGQVAAALDGSAARAAAGPAIAELFRAAVRAGKRARTETGISRHALSLGGLAVRHAASLCADLERRRIAVIGSGTAAEQVLSSLPAGARQGLTIVSRDGPRAASAAARWGGRPALIGDLPAVLAAADVAFTATDGADLITARTLHGRRGGDALLLVVDIAAPPNVAREVAEVPGVRVIGMTELSAASERAQARRERERPAVERIVAEEVADFERRAREARARPLVAVLHRRAEQTRRRLVETTLQQIGDLDDGARERIDQLTRTLVNTLLHEPTTRIRSAATDGAWEEYERVARDLFDLR